MDRKAFDRLLAEGAHSSLPSLLLFEGEAEILKQEAFRRLRHLLLPEGLEDLNETLLDQPDTDALIAAAETVPFMADRRLVVVRDHPALTGRAEGDDRLAAYLPQVPPSAVLLFYCTRKPDGRKKLYTTLKKAGAVVSFDPPRDRELTSFVVDAFHRRGRECDQRTAEYLIFTSGPDVSVLTTEIEKIAAHSRDGAPVHPDEITLLATPSAECTVFQLTDAVVAGQNDRAFTLLRNQLRAGTDRLYMLAMLLRQFRLLQHVKIMQFEKKNPSFIRSALGVPAFAAEQYLRQAASLSNRQVKSAVSVCFETEAAVKSGRLNAEGSLEMVMIQLLNIRK